VARWSEPILWRILWCYFRHRFWPWFPRNCGESLPCRYDCTPIPHYFDHFNRNKTVCGPPKYAELRINFAQAFNAIGTVVGPVLGSYAFFKETSDDVAALQSVQWVYLAIGIFVFCLAAVFFVSNIPEVTDADMAFQVAETHVEGTDKPFWKQYRLFHAAFAQFTYTGAQGLFISS
jgi:fucose permease